MQHKPGDIVNGYVLGADNVWCPVAAARVPPVPLSYWGRYRRRWRKTYLVFAVFAPLSLLGTPGGPDRYGLLDLLLAATLLAAIMASFVNLVVALFEGPSAGTPPPRPSR